MGSLTEQALLLIGKIQHAAALIQHYQQCSEKQCKTYEVQNAISFSACILNIIHKT
jgi:hypothetical protein